MCCLLGRFNSIPSPVVGDSESQHRAARNTVPYAGRRFSEWTARATSLGLGDLSQSGAKETIEYANSNS